MMTIVCLTVLVYCIMGKDIRSLLEKVKDIDWKEKGGGGEEIIEKIRPYALTAGRVTAKPLLQLYYVMENESTPTLDKVLIYAAIFIPFRC